ncbi:hypothetical protein [Pseudoduganella sp. HUAS MS19]
MEMTLTGVAVKGSDETFLAAIIDEYSDESPDHCMVLRYHGGAFRQLLLDHAVCAIAVPPGPGGPVFFLSPHGEITLAGSSGLSTETIDPSGRGPSSMVLVRGAAWIGTQLYACGMARMVYRRDDGGRWHAIDAEVFVPREQRERAVGFHAIGGSGPENIYCAGQYGEIWFYDGAHWRQEDSPANLALTGICVRRSGDVVIVGMAGTLLSGRHGRWAVIDHQATERDFWGVAEFLGEIYVANRDGVFRLAGETLELIDLGVGPARTTAYLAANDEVLWSVGSDCAVYTKDGKNWTEVPLPA